MACAKIYNFIINDFSTILNGENSVDSSVIDKDYISPSFNHATTEVENSYLLQQIGERLACYFYYLNFMLNLFFYSLNWPRKTKNANNRQNTIKLIIIASQSKSVLSSRRKLAVRKKAF